MNTSVHSRPHVCPAAQHSAHHRPLGNSARVNMPQRALGSHAQCRITGNLVTVDSIVHTAADSCVRASILDHSVTAGHHPTTDRMSHLADDCRAHHPQAIQLDADLLVHITMQQTTQSAPAQGTFSHLPATVPQDHSRSASLQSPTWHCQHTVRTLSLAANNFVRTTG
jgi:hypothetical protein